jgi:hypothetical protein
MTLLMHDPRPHETGSSPSLAHELTFDPGQRHATSSIIDP